jgi:Holliday junction resolvase RusA-like endonuclease
VAGVIRLEIPGRPVPWQRVRTNQGRFFTPQATRDYEEAVAMLCRATRESLGETLCSIDIELYPTKAIVTITPLPDEPARKIKGDVDNYAKAILDGLQKGQMIENDKQVTELRVSFPTPSD